MMAFQRRQIVVVLLLFLLAVSSTAVPITGNPYGWSLKTVKKPVLFEGSHSQHVEEREKDEEVVERRRMNMEIEDYPGTGANPNHDPRPPGGV